MAFVKHWAALKEAFNNNREEFRVWSCKGKGKARLKGEGWYIILIPNHQCTYIFLLIPSRGIIPLCGWVSWWRASSLADGMKKKKKISVNELSVASRENEARFM
jgi:hypothetical protein